ncbi:hypothetical protein D3C77_154690 [compost metagenome]
MLTDFHCQRAGLTGNIEPDANRFRLVEVLSDTQVWGLRQARALQPILVIQHKVITYPYLRQLVF